MHSNNDSFVRWFDDPLAPPPQFSSTQNPKQLKTRKNRGEAEKLWQRGLSGYPTSHTQPPQRVVASLICNKGPNHHMLAFVCSQRKNLHKVIICRG